MVIEHLAAATAAEASQNLLLHHNSSLMLQLSIKRTSSYRALIANENEILLFFFV